MNRPNSRPAQPYASFLASGLRRLYQLVSKVKTDLLFNLPAELSAQQVLSINFEEVRDIIAELPEVYDDYLDLPPGWPGVDPCDERLVPIISAIVIRRRYGLPPTDEEIASFAAFLAA